MSRATQRLLVPVVPCGSFQCHGSLNRPYHDCLVSCQCSSQMLRHCLWPTATTEKQRREPSGGSSYLPGCMTHGHAMLPHAGLTTVIRRVSYFIGGGGSTVYPPLSRAKAWRTITQYKRFMNCSWHHADVWLFRIFQFGKPSGLRDCRTTNWRRMSSVFKNLLAIICSFNKRFSNGYLPCRPPRCLQPFSWKLLRQWGICRYSLFKHTNSTATFDDVWKFSCTLVQRHTFLLSISIRLICSQFGSSENDIHFLKG